MLRAQRLSATGRLAQLREADLTPARLAAAVDRALAGSAEQRPAEPGVSGIDLAGVATSAQILSEFAAKVPAARAGQSAHGATEEW